MTNVSQVAFQVMWNRLISVVEEQAQALGQDRLFNLCAGSRRFVCRCL